MARFWAQEWHWGGPLLGWPAFGMARFWDGPREGRQKSAGAKAGSPLPLQKKNAHATQHEVHNHKVAQNRKTQRQLPVSLAGRLMTSRGARGGSFVIFGLVGLRP